MATLDFSKITPDNGAARDLAELLFLKYYSEPNALEKFVSFQTNVHTGDKVAGIGRFGPMGKKLDKICNSSYESTTVNTQEKSWEIARWAILQQVCIDDIEATLVKHSLKSGTDVADMTGDEYIDTILMPLLEDSITRALWRMVWFGDKDASNIVVGDNNAVTGTLTAGLDPTLFTTCDGLWKRLIMIATANSEQRVAISANTEKTRALQKSKLREKGVAQRLFDDVKDAMPMVLRQQENKALLCTQSVADALSRDIRDNNKGSELQWEVIFSGITMTQYDGNTIFAIALWDEMLHDFFRVKGGDLDYVINPHRIVATTLDNLRAATSSSETLASLKSWYENKDHTNYIEAMDTIGTQIWQDDLCVVAY